jgi:hypothetical protein
LDLASFARLEVHEQLSAIVQLQRAKVWRLHRSGILGHSTLHVMANFRPCDDLVARACHEPAGHRLDKAAREQRMPRHRTAIHGELIIERGGDDATAPPRTKLLERLSARILHAAAAPLKDGPQGEAAVTCIEDHEDVLRGDPRDLREPALEA